ncbi:hypothetical protein BN7_2879 [Wickerhamomyces ciferrii]|uniref:Uncharacterized protein n=1 Tax=Wickerhamomyces ciferrii (strain ATCC 14091 / BCRC 22168 / CBS 111 / JCM 3599 / NBRC 0793 / NRRL Y-1031 F-60-10) TaxID=1206466 RepID=K0KK77_WICCF|nr:uncharacterized protein BN7_2879 [Wickerhamomyces ciferrii]CCH43331.1 hypothetical protein BN7_2879 [Wickerhamomyces ciferrii]
MSFDYQTEIDNDAQRLFCPNIWKLPSTGGEIKEFNQGEYPTEVIHSNMDSLSNGKFIKALTTDYPEMDIRWFSPARHYSGVAQKLVKIDVLEQFTVNHSIDNIYPKFKWWFELLPYEKCSTEFFLNRSKFLLSQFIGRMRIKLRHIDWKIRIGCIYPLRYNKALLLKRTTDFLQPKVSSVVIALKKLVTPKTQYALFSFGDKPSLLGPFPIEIWLRIIEQADIDKAKATAMIYNNFWAEIVAPIMYTNIHCFLSIRNTSALRTKDYDFVYNGPNLVDYGYSDYNKYERLNNVLENDFEVLDLYPSSKRRMRALINSKNPEDQSAISVVTNHKSLLKLVRTLNNKSSIMKKYLKNISLDVFAPSDWMTMEGSREVKERFDTMVRNNHKDKEIKVLQTRLEMAHSALVHIHEFDHLHQRRKKEEYQGKKCHHIKESQHCFFQEDFTLGPSIEPLTFAKPNYTTSLDLYNKIVNCFINGERQSVKTINEENGRGLDFTYMFNTHRRPGVSFGLTRFDDKYHKCDISVGETSYLKNKGELAKYIDNIVNTFLGFSNSSCSIMITGVVSRDDYPIDFEEDTYTIYYGPQLITINKDT